MGHPQGGLGLDLSFIAIDLTHARFVPEFADLLPLHQASLAGGQSR
jgi:hypothetical protein